MLYPSDFRILASVGVDSGKPFAFLCPGNIPLIPVLPGYLPVRSAARAGLHTGQLVYQSVNLTPSEANLSREGVLKSVAPIQERSPYP